MTGLLEAALVIQIGPIRHATRGLDLETRAEHPEIKEMASHIIQRRRKVIDPLKEWRLQGYDSNQTHRYVLTYKRAQDNCCQQHPDLEER